MSYRLPNRNRFDKFTFTELNFPLIKLTDTGTRMESKITLQGNENKFVDVA